MKCKTGFLVLFILIFTFITGCLDNTDQEQGPAQTENGTGETETITDVDTADSDSTDTEPDWQLPLLLVVYEQDGNIINSTGFNPPRLIVDGPGNSDPLLSPDGQKVLFRKNIEPGVTELPRFELWVADIDGNNAHLLVGPEDLPGTMGQVFGYENEVMLDRLPAQVAWTPDSKYVAFNTVLEAGYGINPLYDLWLIDPETGVLEQILDDRLGGSFTFSPDGRKLIVADAESVSMADADGSNRRTLLTFPFVNTASEYPFIPQPVWAPDGNYGLAVISSPEPFGEDEDLFFSIWKLPLTGDAIITATVPGVNFYDAMSGKAISPDGLHIAYTSGWFPEGKTHLATIDGAEVATFDEFAFEVAGWSADGKMIIFDADFHLFLGGLNREQEELQAPEEIYAWLAYIKWVSPTTYVGVDWSYFLEESILWTTEIDGESRIIDTDVGYFDALLIN